MFPLTLSDISLWLAVSALILLVAVEFISHDYAGTYMVLDKKRFRLSAFALSGLFLLTVAIQVYQLIAPNA